MFLNFWASFIAFPMAYRRPVTDLVDLCLAISIQSELLHPNSWIIEIVELLQTFTRTQARDTFLER